MLGAGMSGDISNELVKGWGANDHSAWAGDGQLGTAHRWTV